MGCFNRTGFYSHLPITYGDDIVMFMCADTSKVYNGKDSCPISVIGTGYVPIALPFFGKYNDYGGIEDVVDDANHQYFAKTVGIPFEKFCNLMHDMDGVTIASLRESIKYFSEHPEEDPCRASVVYHPWHAAPSWFGSGRGRRVLHVRC